MSEKPKWNRVARMRLALFLRGKGDRCRACGAERSWFHADWCPARLVAGIPTAADQGRKDAEEMYR